MSTQSAFALNAMRAGRKVDARRSIPDPFERLKTQAVFGNTALDMFDALVPQRNFRSPVQ